MIGFNPNQACNRLLARVYPLRVSDPWTNAGTAHVFGPERIPIDPSVLADTRGLAAEGKYTWPC